MDNQYLKLKNLEYYSALDDDFIVGLLNSYMSNINGYKAAIMKSYNSGDLDGLKSDAHALLSSARALFFQPLVENLAAIEIDCAAGDSGQLGQRIELLEIQITEGNQEILSYLESLGPRVNSNAQLGELLSRDETRRDKFDSAVKDREENENAVHKKGRTAK